MQSYLFAGKDSVLPFVHCRLQCKIFSSKARRRKSPCRDCGHFWTVKPSSDGYFPISLATLPCLQTQLIRIFWNFFWILLAESLITLPAQVWKTSGLQEFSVKNNGDNLHKQILATRIITHELASVFFFISTNKKKDHEIKKNIWSIIKAL